ncbi:MAG: hypothetical protein ACJ8H8_31630 [Geminicoccaceae bacterium]
MSAQLTPEEESKDRFFRRVAEIAEEMVAAHGKDFSMGALVLAARWIAENKLGTDAAPAREAVRVN